MRGSEEPDEAGGGNGDHRLSVLTTSALPRGRLPLLLILGMGVVPVPLELVVVLALSDVCISLSGVAGAGCGESGVEAGAAKEIAETSTLQFASADCTPS
jgi:hypothetical protein